MKAFKIIRQNWRVYLLLNVIFVALFLTGLFYAQSHPEAQQTHLSALRSALTGGNPLLTAIADAYYAHRTLFLGIVFTFLINLLIGALLQISLPSLIVPFVGLLVVGYRAVLWGMAYGSGFGVESLNLLPMALEGEGYILAAFAAYLHGAHFLFSSRFGLTSRKEGYKTGIKVVGKLIWLVGIMLLAAAYFEAPRVLPETGQSFPPGAKVQSLTIGENDSSVVVPYSGSTVFFDARDVQPEDAKIVGVVLEDITYFRRHDPKVAKLSRRQSYYSIELYLDDDHWNSPDVADRFSMMINSLRRIYPDRRYQILAFCLDDSGGRKETVFKD
jgi:hypothetical protein